MNKEALKSVKNTTDYIANKTDPNMIEGIVKKIDTFANADTEVKSLILTCALFVAISCLTLVTLLAKHCKKETESCNKKINKTACTPPEDIMNDFYENLISKKDWRQRLKNAKDRNVSKLQSRL